MEITYNAFFYKEHENMYSVVFPDIEEGVTQGDTLDNAIFMARDYLETRFEQCKIADLPTAQPLEQWLQQQKEQNTKDKYDGKLICVMPITTHIKVKQRCEQLNTTFVTGKIETVKKRSA